MPRTRDVAQRVKDTGENRIQRGDQAEPPRRSFVIGTFAYFAVNRRYRNGSSGIERATNGPDAHVRTYPEERCRSQEGGSGFHEVAPRGVPRQHGGITLRLIYTSDRRNELAVGPWSYAASVLRRKKRINNARKREEERRGRRTNDARFIGEIKATIYEQSLLGPSNLAPSFLNAVLFLRTFDSRESRAANEPARRSNRRWSGVLFSAMISGDR